MEIWRTCVPGKSSDSEARLTWALPRNKKVAILFGVEGRSLRLKEEVRDVHRFMPHSFRSDMVRRASKNIAHIC